MWRIIFEMMGGMQAQVKIPLLRSEEHTSELQSHSDLVCRLLLEKKTQFTLPRSNSAKIRASRLRDRGTNRRTARFRGSPNRGLLSHLRRSKERIQTSVRISQRVS